MYFENVKKNFGFGAMRLPMKDGKVDMPHFEKMVDMFMDAGFNYFDTAHGYISGMSETALRDGLAARYPRDKYILTNKLTEGYFQSEEDIRPFFKSQLEACGVEYFDFYLMHAQNHRNYEKYKACRAYETAYQLKKEGFIKHVGLSFHDSAAVLDKILTEQPEIEVVQIQFNYFDYEDKGVQSRLCYEVCRKHGKPVIVMEPVKGGTLVNLRDEAKAVFTELGDTSPAAMAIRFAASFEGIFMVLSGMSNVEQMADNINNMKDFKPLDEKEFAAINRVVEVIKSIPLIQCTGCRYCVDGCPQQILIPKLFSCVNRYRQFDQKDTWGYRNAVKDRGVPSSCIGCGKCEKSCPQNLPIRELLKEVTDIFE